MSAVSAGAASDNGDCVTEKAFHRRVHPGRRILFSTCTSNREQYACSPILRCSGPFGDHTRDVTSSRSHSRAGVRPKNSVIVSRILNRLSALFRQRRQLPGPAREAAPSVLLADGDLVCKWLPFAPGAEAFLVLPAKTTDPVVRLYLRNEMDNAYMLTLLAQTTVSGDAVIDLGCHVGTFAVGAAAMRRRLLAVDAARSHVDLVERSRVMNGFSNLTIVHAVISKQQDAVPFKEDGLFGAVDFSPGADAPLVPALRVDDSSPSPVTLRCAF